MELAKINTLWSEIPKNSGNSTLDQLIKDLQRASIDSSILTLDTDNESIELEKVLNLLMKILADLIAVNEERFWQLIYLIDLPESIFNELKKVELIMELELISKLIVYREWQKTEFRKRFS